MPESCCSRTAPCCAPAGAQGEAPSKNVVSQTDGRLTFRDRLGAWKARWGLGRMRYFVEPGLYRFGAADPSSPVLVTANYKMTFDRVRSEWSGLDAWILVLDTKGINVWCAAGKGTFGTDELVSKVESADLRSTVAHRTLIVPQLGAPGVAAHEVRKRTGFKVVYGPVYAKDLKRFLQNGLRATPDMRKVRFGLRERLPLIPMEVVPTLRFVPLALGVLLLLRWLDGSLLWARFWRDGVSFLGAVAMGSVLFQILLPWLPGRSFAFKGAGLGLIWALLSLWLLPVDLWTGLSNLLVFPALVSFLALNFTGATTFTSLSGVQKEIRIGVPLMIAAAGIGIGLRVTGLFLA